MHFYHQPTTDIVAYAWNAAMVCVPCTRIGLLSFTEVQGVKIDKDAPTDEVREIVGSVLGYLPDQLGLLDTSEFPQPVTAGEEGINDDSCDRCSLRIRDTY